MARRPLASDGLTYRTFNLTRPMRLTWTQLYRQFGVDPSRLPRCPKASPIRPLTLSARCVLQWSSHLHPLRFDNVTL